jgi:hypothetical protein
VSIITFSGEFIKEINNAFLCYIVLEINHAFKTFASLYISGRRGVVSEDLAHKSLVFFFVPYLTTIFQQLRLYSVDFYSILIRLPSSSEAGETRVRNMAAEFCRLAPACS